MMAGSPKRGWETRCYTVTPYINTVTHVEARKIWEYDVFYSILMRKHMKTLESLEPLKDGNRW